MIELTNLKPVEFDIKDTTSHGRIVGIGTIEQPVIGSMVLVEVMDGTLPNDAYPYHVVSLPQICLRERQ